MISSLAQVSDAKSPLKTEVVGIFHDRPRQTCTQLGALVNASHSHLVIATMIGLLTVLVYKAAEWLAPTQPAGVSLPVGCRAELGRHKT